MPTPTELAERQLAAYNAADLDAFVACYHPDVVVRWGAEVEAEGRSAFRERYADLFARGGFGASVPARVAEGAHVVDRELWWRLDPETGDRSEGALLVHYTVRDDLIAEVHFFD